MRTLKPGHLEEDCPITKFSQNKRFSCVFGDRPIKCKYSTMQAFELTWPLRKQPSNWWMLLHGPYEKKILRIFFSENVVNKACGVAVVFALEGFSELWNCASMICRLPVGSDKQRLTWQVKKTFTRVMSAWHMIKKFCIRCSSQGNRSTRTKSAACLSTCS